MATQPIKSSSKLSRAQVQEILERNAKLHKGDTSFVPYIVQLAMYLLEYEYDWRESDSTPPEFIRRDGTEKPGPKLPGQPEKSAKPGLTMPAPGKGTNSSPKAVTNPKGAPVTRGGAITKGNSGRQKMRSYGKLGGSDTPTLDRPCPHCGTEIPSDELICPACRNLTK